MVLGSFPKAAAPPEVVGCVSVIARQLGLLLRKLVVFHNPPPLVSRYTVFGSVGCGRMLRMRPLSVTLSFTPFSMCSVLVGPIEVHTGVPAGAVAPGISCGNSCRCRAA